LRALASTTKLEHLVSSKSCVSHFVTLGALAPRRLGVARRDPNYVVSRRKFVQVVLCLLKGEASKVKWGSGWKETLLGGSEVE
jgi:hypothetical protein